MTCESCKGTGQVVLLYSSVPCEDCVPGRTFVVGPLPAAPMAKCGDWAVGDRFIGVCSQHRGTVVGFATRPHWGDGVLCKYDGDPPDQVGFNKPDHIKKDCI